MPGKFEVVISGIAGRFPECDDVESYKRMLYNQESSITYDGRKWPVGYKYKFGEESIPLGTGKYTDIKRFDARVFACSTMLAKCTDIINRKILEPSFEAIMDAGINPTSLMGANIGCYMSSTINEVESIKIFSRVGDKMYIIGGSKAMLSNRVSFALNLTGPSYTYYSGVLGGFEALTAAYQNIVQGRVEAAIVGGSSSIIDPKLSLNFKRLGYLSADSVTKCFDADASGYGRSEGAVVLFLQRAEDAKRSYGTLRFSDCYYFGMNPNTLIGYDEHVLETNFKEIYSQHSQAKPSDISFLEMNACGVQRLDKLESEAVARVFCSKRDGPLLIGSVKSQSGHTEGAAALMSVLKVVFALDSDYIAPNMNFTAANPEIKPLRNGTLKVVSEKTKLPGSVAGINTLSISGLTGHAVVVQYPKEKTEENTNDNVPRLILLCGRTEKGLQSVVEKIEAMPLNKEFLALTNDIFRTPITTHIYKAYTIVPPLPRTSNTIDISGGENRPIWFVFSGMGSQWNGMGKGLLDIPIFAEAIKRCDNVLKPEGIDIYHILTSDDVTLFDNIVNAFVGIIAVQVGLINIMKAIGIVPDGIIGHSVGENACAYADGCLTLEQSVLASYARGIASNEAETIKGMMAAIGRGYNQIKDSLPEGIEVACHNSAENCTLTGPAELVNQFVEKLQKEDIFARTVNVSNIAYHSKHIAVAAPILQARLSQIIKEPIQRSSKWISTSVPEDNWGTALARNCSAEYLTNNLISTVLFQEGCKHIPENAIIIEIAPHGLLQAILKRSLNKSCTNISLTLRSPKANSINFLLSTIGKLFIAGAQPDVNALYPKIEYPVPRGTPNTGVLATWDHSESFENIEPHKETPLSEEVIKIQLNEGSRFSYIKDHQVKSQKIIPLSLYLYLTWHMLSILKNEKMHNLNVIFENIKIHRDLHITLEKPRNILIMIQHGTGFFEIMLEKKKSSDQPTIVMTGMIQIAFEPPQVSLDDSLLWQAKRKIDGDSFYEYLEHVGYKLEDQFANLEELMFSDTDCFAKIRWNRNWVCFLDSVMKMHMYSDFKNTDLLFPTRIRRLEINSAVFDNLKMGDEIICHKDLVTKRLCCNGLELSGFMCGRSTFNNYLDLEGTSFKLQTKSFVPHANSGMQHKGDFANLCLQLVVESMILLTNNMDAQLHVIDDRNILLDTLKKVVKQNEELQPNIKFVNARNADVQNDASLIITSDLQAATKLHIQMKQNSNILFVLLSSRCSMTGYMATRFLYVLLHETQLGRLYFLIALLPLAHSDGTLHPADAKSYSNISEDFIKISEQSFADGNISLHKQVIKNGNYLPAIVDASDRWITKSVSNLEVKKSQPVILIRRYIDVEDLDIMLMKKRRLFSNIRYMYILDDDADNFSLQNPLYLKQIQCDSPVNILRNGEWGSYRNTGLKLKSTPEKSQSTKINYDEIRMKAVKLKFLGEVNEIENQKPSEHRPKYTIEYSGTYNFGQRVMGIGECTPGISEHKPDPFYTWLLPEDWGLDEACTIPLIYLQAYFAIFFVQCKTNVIGIAYKNGYKKSSSVLVNSNNLSFKEASIEACLHHKIDVYVTISNGSEAAVLLRKFPSLNECHLLSQDRYTYEVKLLMLTKGKGVDLVISTFISSKHVQAGLNCVSSHGRYVQIGEIEDNIETQLGMFVFIKSVAFRHIQNGHSYFMELPVEVKKSLSDMLVADIKAGVVKPLTHRLLNRPKMAKQNLQSSFVIKQISKFNENSSTDKIEKTKFSCNGNSSFIIIGSTKNVTFWFELLEWLRNRGARKFIVALDDFIIPSKLTQQVDQLVNQTKGSITLMTCKSTETVDDALNLIVEANSFAPLAAIFFASMNTPKMTIQNVDKASRHFPQVHFVSLFSGGLQECESRIREGFPALIVHSKHKIHQFLGIAPQITCLLNDSNHVNQEAYIYELIDKTEEEKTLLSTCLSQHLSIDLARLVSIGEHATDKLIFSEVVTRCTKYSESKNVYPLFIIPGIDSKSIQPLISNLMYPAFCATFTKNCDSAFDCAQQLLMELQTIQLEGPVTIIGDTWSGCVALELALLLQSNKRMVKLFLVEGSPFTWQKYIRNLGDLDTPEFDENLLGTLLKIDTRNNLMRTNSKWTDKLHQHLKNLKLEDASISNVTTAVMGIRSRLITTAKYSHQQERLKQVVLFKQKIIAGSPENYHLSDNIEIHLFKEQKYSDLLKNSDIARIIHDEALFSWWK